MKRGCETDWSSTLELQDFYKSTFASSEIESGLKSGLTQTGALLLSNTAGDRVLSFVRRYEQDEVLVILNLAPEARSVIITGQTLAGSYKDVFNPAAPDYISGQPLHLAAWDYRVYTIIKMRSG